MKMVSSFSQRRQSWLAAALNNSASRSGELGWVDFHVMRRTHATLVNDLHDDPKLVADQLGHSLEVNQNVYTRVSILKRKQVVDALEASLPLILS